MSKILIDGEVADSYALNPRIHRWIGMFRPPYDSRLKYGGFMKGVDDYYIDLVEQKMRGYMEGRYDIPQYVTIRDDSNLNQVASTTAEPQSKSESPEPRKPREWILHVPNDPKRIMSEGKIYPSDITLFGWVDGADCVRVREVIE